MAGRMESAGRLASRDSAITFAHIVPDRGYSPFSDVPSASFARSIFAERAKRISRDSSLTPRSGCVSPNDSKRHAPYAYLRIYINAKVGYRLRNQAIEFARKVEV